MHRSTHSSGWLAGVCLAAGAACTPTSAGNINVIAYTGLEAPDGNGVFDFFNAPSISQNGQTAFRCYFSETLMSERDKQAVVRGTNATRTLIYRQGQFVPEGNGMFDDAGFGIVNDAGQVAFQFELADGRMGVAVTAIPAPGAMVLMGLGTLAVIRRRR